MSGRLKIAGKSGITSLITRFKTSHDRAMVWLNKHPYLLYLAINLGGDSSFKARDNEYKERLSHLLELKD